MPLPLLFIGIAAASGMFGIGGTVKAGFDAKNAKQINKSANELVQESTDYLNAQRLACGNSLTRLGAEKMAVLNGTISDFLNVFTQIKNVDFKETEGLDELQRPPGEHPERDVHLDRRGVLRGRGRRGPLGTDLPGLTPIRPGFTET